MEDMFADLDERYPGAKQFRRPVYDHPPLEIDDLDPTIFVVNGKLVEFFHVGQVAKVLGVATATMRRWERTGVIPKTIYRDLKRNQRRLYTRYQASAIVRIAREEEIRALRRRGKGFSSTRFVERLREDWRQ